MIHEVEIRTASRLHFGLLGWGAGLARQFGGVGLMVNDPGIELVAQRAASWNAIGPLADRVMEVARRIEAWLRPKPVQITPIFFRVSRVSAEHVGLGTGTQLSLAVAKAMLTLHGCPDFLLDTKSLAEISGRGMRSGIGLHGFELGGLIVDGGHSAAGKVPPILVHKRFPAGWNVLLIIPQLPRGRHGPDEFEAFQSLPPVPETVIDRLCRLVLLGILPAVANASLPEFGQALTELQQIVGSIFAPAQGGRALAHPMLEAIAADLRANGLHGVGQSSWGPTLYAFTEQPVLQLTDMLEYLSTTYSLPPGSVLWTRAAEAGARVSAR